MEWLDRAQAKAASDSLSPKIQPQSIELLANREMLRAEIPMEPELALCRRRRPPSAVHRWIARVGVQLVVIECDVTDWRKPSAVSLTVGFPETPNPLGDWAVLLDLAPLPKLIYVTRPLFIESRTAQQAHVVYRPDPQGWKTLIYKAASRDEAEELLLYLRQDPWNDGCFVGDPEPPGPWLVCHRSVDVGHYGTELNQASKYACEWSLRFRNQSVTVKHASGGCPLVNEIRDGQVVDRSAHS